MTRRSRSPSRRWSSRSSSTPSERASRRSWTAGSIERAMTPSGRRPPSRSDSATRSTCRRSRADLDATVRAVDRPGEHRPLAARRRAMTRANWPIRVAGGFGRHRDRHRIARGLAVDVGARVAAHLDHRRRGVRLRRGPHRRATAQATRVGPILFGDGVPRRRIRRGGRGPPAARAFGCRALPRVAGVADGRATVRDGRVPLPVVPGWSAPLAAVAMGRAGRPGVRGDRRWSGRPSAPGPFPFYPAFENPFGIEGPPVVDVVSVFYLLTIACVGASVLSLIGRWRVGGPVERAQLKWVTAAAALIATVMVAYAVLFGPRNFNDVADLAVALALAFFPIAIGIAIMRYRLFEIDRLVSRTIAYVVVTALLVAVYAGAILLLQGPLGAITGGETISRGALDTRRRGALPAAAPPGPGGRRPSLRSRPVRCGADVPRVLRAAPRRGRHRRRSLRTSTRPFGRRSDRRPSGSGCARWPADAPPLADPDRVDVVDRRRDRRGRSSMPRAAGRAAALRPLRRHRRSSSSSSAGSSPSAGRRTRSARSCSRSAPCSRGTCLPRCTCICPGDPPGAEFAALWVSILDAPMFILVALLLILFPDGRLPSPRWRWALVAGAFGIGCRRGRLCARCRIRSRSSRTTRVRSALPGSRRRPVYAAYVVMLVLLVGAADRCSCCAGGGAGSSSERRSSGSWRRPLVMLVAEIVNVATFRPTSPTPSPRARPARHRARPDRDRDRDPPLPPVRDRPDHQPDHRLRRRDRASWPSVFVAGHPPAPGRARAVHPGRDRRGRGLDARGVRALPAAPATGPAGGRSTGSTAPATTPSGPPSPSRRGCAARSTCETVTTDLARTVERRGRTGLARDLASAPGAPPDDTRAGRVGDRRRRDHGGHAS